MSGKPEENTFQHILPLFPLIYKKPSRSATCQGQGSVDEWLLKYQGQNQYRSKNGDEYHYRSKNVHKSTCESANFQLPSECQTILNFGTLRRKVAVGPCSKSELSSNVTVFLSKNNLKLIHWATRSIICQCVSSLSEKVQSNLNSKFTVIEWQNLEYQWLQLEIIWIFTSSNFDHIFWFWITGRDPRNSLSGSKKKESYMQAVRLNLSISWKEICKLSSPPPLSLFLNCICSNK